MNTETRKASPLWTPEEEDLIRQYYPNGGATATAPYLHGRAFTAIQQRAFRLGVSDAMSKHSHPKASIEPQSETAWKLPAPHEYGPEDYAMREWGHITRTGQLVAIIGGGL